MSSILGGSINYASVLFSILYTDGEELGHQAIALIEENLRLRAQLLTSANHDQTSPQNLDSSDEPQHDDPQEQEEGESSVEAEEQRPKASQQQSSTVTMVCDEEVASADAEVDKDLRERERNSPLAAISDVIVQQDRQSSSGGGEGEEKDVGDGSRVHDSSNGVGNAEKDGVSVEQPWPITSLLSVHSTRSGVREHTTFNLPILSPTYIAEHCSTTACEQQFFNPLTSSTLLPLSTTNNLTDVAPSDAAFSTQHTPFNAPAITSTTAVIAETALRPVDTSVSSLHTFQSHTTAVTSVAAISVQNNLPHSSSPSHHSSPQTRQSIVQPWVDSSGSSNSRVMENRAAVLSSVTSQEAPSQPVAQRWSAMHQPTETSGSRQQRNVASTTSHYNSVATNTRRLRHSQKASRCSVYTRDGFNRGHAQFSETGPLHHANINGSTALEIFSPNCTHTSNRGCSESSSTRHSTRLPFPPQTASPLNQTAMNHSQSFPSPSVDPYYPYYHQLYHTAAHHQHNSPLLPSHLTPHHTSQCTHHSHTLNHHHQLQQNYSDLLPPPHHHHSTPPPPTFAPPHHLRPHNPSHHNTAVWRPYSNQQRTATRFSLSDILSPSPAASPCLPAAAISPHQGSGGRIPSFFVDHLLDDL